MSRCKLLKVPRACLFVCLAFVLFSCGFCLCVLCECFKGWVEP